MIDKEYMTIYRSLCFQENNNHEKILYAFCVDCIFFFQAEDGIRDSVASRGLGDVYKRQMLKKRQG